MIVTNLEQIEQRLHELAPSGPDDLSRAMSYALFGGGKRLRPRLVMAAAETFGIDPALALDPACAIEMVHTYSLVHDDLPCMDNDDFRRGRPTVHRVFIEGIAVLTGDALLTEAFRIISESNGLSDHQKVRLITVLAARAGKDGMVGGQAIDILSSDMIVTQELTLQIDQKKTGELFSSSLEFGAIIAHAPEAIQMRLRGIGHQLGFAYQILDDLEDAQNDDKATMLSILGHDASRERLRRTIDEIYHQLSKLPSGAEPIKSILDLIFHTGQVVR
ncbi:MAG: putative farnesyltranstransferase [Parachlamydiales bacterium]|nr:putative farnesyltranstransferase [Parachlamydiales bacterium]